MIGWANFVASIELRYHVRLCGHPQYPALQKPSSIGIGTLKSLTADIEASTITFEAIEPAEVLSLRADAEATGTVRPRKGRKDAGKKRQVPEPELEINSDMSESGSDEEEKEVDEDEDEEAEAEGAGGSEPEVQMADAMDVDAIATA
jgi:hypothetical protein